jgi:hypothetical protein
VASLLEKLNECTVGEKFLNLLLLQVVPGRESEVINRIKKVKPRALVFYGMGRYDLMIISEESDFATATDLRKETLPYLLDYDVVCGYKWVKKGERESEVNKDAKIVGLCCLELNWDEIEESGIAIEQSIAAQIYDSIAVPVTVFGGLGNKELISIVTCSKLEDLASAAMQMRRLTLPSSGMPILDITTIPGISVKAHAEGSLDAVSVQALLLLSLNGGSFESVLTQLKTCGANDMSPIFGFHDVMARVNLNVGELLNTLLTMRQNRSTFPIYSSNTLLRHDDKEDAKHAAIHWVDCSPNRKIKNFLEERPELAEDYGYYYNLYLTTTIDPLSRFMFRDLTSFFLKLSRLYKKARELWEDDALERYQKKMDGFDTVIDCLRLAIQQRYSGTQIGNLLGAKSFNIEAFGGSKKLLMAHEALPLMLLEAFDMDWTGFSIFGYVHKFYRSRCGIINMPGETKLHPEKWWGTYHEVGHEAYLQLKKVDLAKYSIVNEMTKKFEYEHFGLLREAFADMFDYYFGFAGNWGLYMNTVWSYLVENFSINDFYIARMMLVYFSLGPKKDVDFRKHPNQVVTEFKILFSSLEEVAKKIRPKLVPFDEKVLRIAEKKCFALLNVTRLLAQYFEGKVNFYEGDAEELNKLLHQGICVKTTSPTLIVNAMLPLKDLTLRHRLTAILSLYDSASEHYYPKIS